MDDPSSLQVGVRILLIIFLVLANGFFVASEFALVAVRRSWVETLAAKGDRRAKILLKLLNRIDDCIAAIQLGITMVNLVLGWLGEQAFSRVLVHALAGISSKMLPIYVISPLAIILAFSVVTYITVVVGELVPKALALERIQQIALAVAWPMDIFYRVGRPFTKLLTRSGVFVMRLLKVQRTQASSAMYAEEIQQLINVSHKEGLLEPHEHQLISNIFGFAGAVVREAMCPRADVTAIEASTSFQDVLRVYEDSGYSRIPVFRQQLDNIVGILHGKDLLRYIRTPERFKIEQVVHKPFYVPDSASLDEVLRQMRQKKNHFAIVVDEYGIIEGIITLEDILEELVGEIHDEHDFDDEKVIQKAEGVFVLDGSLTVREVNRRLSLDLPESDSYTTVAGFVMAKMGKLPLLGDEVAHDDLTFTIEKSEGRRITGIRVERKQTIESEREPHQTKSSASLDAR
jgi:CBS domain containing-hemolysin-like protein